MLEKNLWELFVNTGSIEAYLTYSQYKAYQEYEAKGPYLECKGSSDSTLKKTV